MKCNSIIWSILALCLKLLVKVHSKKQNATPRIVNGQIAKIEELPYLVDLRYKGKSICAGSIISPQWILTAAHCLLADDNPESYKVAVGNQVQGKGVHYDVTKMVVHELFDDLVRQRYADLAILKTKGNFKYGTTVRNVNLSKEDLIRDSKYGSNCITAGWGKNMKNGKIVDQSDLLLRSIKMKIVEWPQCDDEWSHLYRSQICAMGTTKGTGTCAGDSGAPLVCNGTQIGIFSYGPKNCVANKSEIYVRVSSFYVWIRYYMQS